jgi:hypothetical protein
MSLWENGNHDIKNNRLDNIADACRIGIGF